MTCLAKQNYTQVGIGGYVFDAVSTFKQLLVLLIHGNIIRAGGWEHISINNHVDFAKYAPRVRI